MHKQEDHHSLNSTCVYSGLYITCGLGIGNPVVGDIIHERLYKQMSITYVTCVLVSLIQLQVFETPNSVIPISQSKRMYTKHLKSNSIFPIKALSSVKLW